MSLMSLLRKAWHHAVHILTKHGMEHPDIRPPDLEELFMVEINKLGVDIQHIVAMLYSNYAGSKSSLDMISKDYEKLEEKHYKLKDENDQLEKRFIRNQRVAKDREYAHDMLLKANIKQIELSNDLLDQREDLESALNTSRYFIYLSGMCGFVLGLACLYFVV